MASAIFNSVDNTRESLVYIARIAEQAERYEDMVEAMKRLASKSASENGHLSVEERNLLSVAYKNVVGSRRASWRILDSIAKNESGKSSDTDHLKSIEKYRMEVEKELGKICDELQSLIASVLLPHAKNVESKAFYLKMAGDYFRYRAEFEKGEGRTATADAALRMYTQADEEGKSLPNTSPIRLGLALNFSVFYYEILDEPNKACNLAKEAFDKAIADLDDLEEENYKDATLIMQLLRDNLALWTQGDDDANA